MSDAYDQLLDATIRLLRDLKAEGIRFVPVSNELLSELASAKQKRQGPAEPVSHAVSSTAATLERTAPETRPQAGQQTVPTCTRVAESPGKGVALSPSSTLSDKSEPWSDLRQRVQACVKCPNLVSSRQNVVFGVGSIEARLMFVGEAPGADEDQQGEPFVGKAGQLLTKMIQAMGLGRSQVYIANILKCRPDTPGQASGNRKPTPEEMQTCIPYLQEQIDLIQPQVLVALGATAVEGLLGKTIGITRLRGNWRSYRGIPLMPTYHPAYLLRNQALSERRRVWEDMLQVMEKLGMPISEKQRNYFLKSA